MLDNINEKQCTETSRLPDETISFNPTSDGDVDALLSKYGPEGLWEISTRLREVAQADVDMAMNQQWSDDE